MKQYVYFFTRQDISPEQQIVQTAHVALKLGKADTNEYIIDASETYFIVVGVRNLTALNGVQCMLEMLGIAFEVFNEPDIGNEDTSIATYPLSEFETLPLKGFDLLKIG